MVFNVEIDDSKLVLINKGYQHESIGVTSVCCVAAMRDAVNKLAKDLKVCDNCKRVFKQVYKGQCFCSVECSTDFENRRQPSLPFNQADDEADDQD